MADEPPVLTVLLAPDGPAAGVRDVLVDLSAAGLLRPFLWATTTSARSGAVEVTGVEGGRRSATTLQAVVTGQRFARVRLGVVVPLAATEHVPADLEARVADTMSFRGIAVTRLRMLVGRPGDTVPPDVGAREGWHNLLVAPEEARGPGEAHFPLPPSTDPVEVGHHAGPVVAGLCGLWAGVDGSPLDDVHPTRGVRAARAFYRRVDAAGLEDEVRARVLDVGDPIPLPQEGGITASAIHDAPTACTLMAGTLMEIHHELLVGHREQPGEDPPRAIRAAEAIRWFLRFLGAALRNAPADWYRGFVVETSAAVARRVQSLVFGSGDSAYEVVVNGRTGRGLPAGMHDVDAVAGRMRERLAAGPGTDLADRPDLRPLWRDFVGGAMTLVDAGRRHEKMPPITVGRGPAVLRSVADCAPSPDADFTAIPVGLAADVEIATLAPGDVFGARLLRARLAQRRAGDPMQAADIGAIEQELDAWERTWGQTYASRVGGIIANWLRTTMDHIRSDLEDLRAAAEARAEPGRRNPLVPWIQVLAVLAVVGLVLGPVLGLRDAVRPWQAAVITLAPLLIWVVVAVVGFLVESRRLFAHLTARARQLSRGEIAERNLRQALIDLRRLTEAYDQYLEWARILGVVLRRPFGRPASRDGGRSPITEGLPQSTRVARVRSADRLPDVVAGLRHGHFTTGWLGDQWKANEAAAARALGWTSYTPHPGSREDLADGVARSGLRAWARLWHAEGPPPEVGDRVWDRVLASLGGEHRDLDRALRGSMTVTEPGTDEELALETFLAGVDRPTGPPTPFVPELFGNDAQVQDLARVAAGGTWVRDETRGLSRVALTVQLGEVLQTYDVRATAGSEEATATAPPAPPELYDDPLPPSSPLPSRRPVDVPDGPV